MKDEGRPRESPLRAVLYVLSLLYSMVVRLRAAGYRTGLFKAEQLPCRVISIGNIAVGGTGKTPLTVLVAELVQRLGYKTAVISRGYKGTAEKSGGIVSDGRSNLMDAETAGDEPYMMAQRLKQMQVPVLVGRNRYEVGRLAVREFHPDVIILDDAFQHLKLARDINLVLLDGKSPLGNFHLLPRGILREPQSALKRANAFILSRLKPADVDAISHLPANLEKIACDRPVFRSSHIPYLVNIFESHGNDLNAETLSPSYGLELLKGSKVFAFSGIANNKDFQQTIEDLLCNVKGFMEFPDHHRYTDGDIQSIVTTAINTGSDILVTTEKDGVRITQWIPLPMKLVVIGVRPSFGRDSNGFHDYIKDRLARLEEQPPTP